MNNQKAFKSDINSIELTKRKMDSTYTELMEMVDKYKEMIEDTEKIYSTESAIMYRNVAVIYVELIKKYLNRDFKEYINNLDSIKGLYTDLYSSIESSTNGGTV